MSDVRALLLKRLDPRVAEIVEREKTAQRWEKGIPHHPKSVVLMEFLSAVDFHAYDDYFCWKTGGDGDNGESLMYEMDAFFENEEQLRQGGN